MFKFNGLDNLKHFFKKIAEITNADKLLSNKVKNDIEKSIKSKFISRTSFNYAPVVSDINSFIRVRWQNKIKSPYIGEITGNLKRSISVSIKKKNDRYEINIDSNEKYAKIQEFGGVIKKKSSKLAIPVNKKAYFIKPRRMSNTVASKRFIFKKLSNRLYKPMYMLVDKVKLEPHNYAESSINENKLLKAIDKYVEYSIFNIEV